MPLENIGFLQTYFPGYAIKNLKYNSKELDFQVLSQDKKMSRASLLYCTGKRGLFNMPPQKIGHFQSDVPEFLTEIKKKQETARFSNFLAKIQM